MGIVSWGLQCGDEDFPGVYSRVGEHYDWITNNVCQISDSPPPYMNCPTKPYPTINLNDILVDITITIRFDDYRSETGWLLESVPDFRNIVYRGFGHYRDRESVDDNYSMSETVTVHPGRFYMLSILDEFADGFCCIAGEGYFRVESENMEYPIVDTTPGILSSPHALRRAFYVPKPHNTDPTKYVTISVTLGAGAVPGNFFMIALENVMHEAMMLYEIHPFLVTANARVVDHQGSGSTIVYSRMFIVPIFDEEFGRQRYTVLVIDDNEAPRASFEVYLGDAKPENLVLAQSGDYGEKNKVSRSFVLFKDENAMGTPTDPTESNTNAATLRSDSGVHYLMPLMLLVSFHGLL